MAGINGMYPGRQSVYQRRYDPSQFPMPPRRPDYPLPAFKGLLAQPAAAPVTGMPASLLDNAPPPVDTMGGLFGEIGGTQDINSGPGPVQSSEPGEAPSQGIPGYAGRQGEVGPPGYNMKQKEKGFLGGLLDFDMATVGSMAGNAFAGPVGGALGAAAGVGVQQEQAHDYMNSIGMPQSMQTDWQDALEAWGRAAAPFGIGRMAGLKSYPTLAQFAIDKYVGPALNNVGWEDNGIDGYGGWGGYSGQQNQGPGADLESEPGDLAAAVADAAAAAGNGGDDSYGTDGASDNNMGGYGDKGDEAPSGAGDSDEWRHGGLLGDDGDGKFEAVKGTLHENEAVLKPEAVGLLGDDLVMQLNNVASLSAADRRKLATKLSAQIISGKPATKRTDFQTGRR